MLPAPLLLALLAPLAHAGGQSIDVELLRPGFSEGLALGVDDPAVTEKGSYRVGTVIQYVRDTLVLYEWGDYKGSVIDHRMGAHLGFSWDPHDDVSLRLVLPTAAQWGTEVPEYAAQVVGVGDLSAGVRWSRWSLGSLDLGLRGDLSVPIGSQESYMGERYPRLHLGGMGAVPLGPVRLVGDLGFTFRAPVDTGEDLYLGQEFVLNAGATMPLVEDRLAISASIVSRLGLTPVWHGSAELPAEALAGVHAWPSERLRLDLGVGKGVGYGYGTSNFRVVAGVTVERAPPEPVVIVEVDLPEELPDEDLPELEDEPTVKVWREGEKARLEEDRIELRDPIQFELGTARILPESIPTLRAVAEILEENWAIGELLIEGHASEEGSFTYNHELSILRAASIYRELMIAGVHPNRMAYRGKGEVEPKEGELAASRRVEFEVLRWAKPGEQTPPEVMDVRQPWDGQEVTVTWPKPPAAPSRPSRLDDPDSDGGMLPWEPLEHMELACEAEVGEQIDSAEAQLTQPGEDGLVDVDDAAMSLARAEAAMSCGPVTDAQMLGRFWLAAGATSVAIGDLEQARESLAAAGRVAPELTPTDYDPWTRRLWVEERRARPSYGWISVATPPGWWTAVDGAEVLDTRAIPAGLHVVQTGVGDQAGFARVVRVQPARETVVSVVKEAASADIHLGATVHDPWRPTTATPAPMPRVSIPASVAWPEPDEDKPGALASLLPDTPPEPWSPPGLAEPAVVFDRTRGVETWYERLDSRDKALGSTALGVVSLGGALVASWSRYKFDQAEDWGAARRYSRINHATVIGASALGLASGGLMTWAVMEGEW